MLIDSLDSKSAWATAYCTVEIDLPLTEGTGAFHITVPNGLSAGRIFLTRYGTYPDLTGIPYLVFDLMESSPKVWSIGFKDAAGYHAVNVEEEGGHLVVPLAEVLADLANITEMSIGAKAPIEAGYSAVLDNMRTETAIPPPIEYPLQITVTPERVAIYIGQTAHLTASPYGGTPPYTIEWIETMTNTVVGTGEIYDFVATEIGDYELFARVTDAIGAIVESTLVTVRVTEAPPPPPPDEPTPPNLSHISVINNKVEPLHVAVWYPWFVDTSSGWFPCDGEKWVDGNYTTWRPDCLRAVLRNIRDVFKCNMIRLFFWMDWYLNNSNKTISSYYPTTEIGCADALHELCQIAAEEGLDVELRMWDWNPEEGKSGNPLKSHTETEFINAWIQFATDFSRHQNVCFNLYDEANDTGIPWQTWKTLAYNTIMQIRQAEVGHVIYVHWGFCGGEGVNWIRDFANHYEVAFSRHEYIHHGTTEAMHQATITIHNEGYPITVTASGVFLENPAETETYRRWWTELLNNNVGISFYTYGRPNVMGFRIQQDTLFPCPPNTVGDMWIEVITGEEPPPPTVTINGQIVNAETNQPIEGAIIRAGSYSTVSNMEGKFIFLVAPATYTITIEKTGYQTLLIENVDATTDVILVDPIPLTPITPGVPEVLKKAGLALLGIGIAYGISKG